MSDIHGNRLALDAVLADLEQCRADAVICLGDAVQGGPQPAETVARLCDLACPIVMGNADAWLLSGVETGNEPVDPDRRVRLDAVREWSLAQLSADDRAFIDGFTPTVSVEFGDGRQLLGFHGSPDSFDDMIFPLTTEDELQRMLGPYADRLLCGGHTHVQQIRHLDRNFYFNPGAVGLAFRHGQDPAQFRTDPWAEYALLTIDAAQMALEFRRVPYDVEELIRIYRASGRPFADEAIKQYGGV
jgi:predicted phosphodiesterase